MVMFVPCRNPSTDNFRLYLPNGATTNSDLAIFQMTIPVPGAVDFVFMTHKKSRCRVLNTINLREYGTKQLNDREHRCSVHVGLNDWFGVLCAYC